MNLKTYTAKSMAEALARVRRDLGADAVVLHTRTYKRGGLLGLGARNVVEVTAGRGREVGRQRRKASERERAQQRAQQRAKSRAAGAYQAGAASDTAAPRGGPRTRLAPDDAPSVGSSPHPATGDLIRRTYAAAKAEVEKAQAGQPPPPAATEPPASTTADAAAEHTRDQQQLAAEMQAVKRMVAQMMRQQKRRAATGAVGGAAGGASAQDKPAAADTATNEGLPDTLMDQYLALLQQEVAEELADEVVDQVRGQLDRQMQGDDAACRSAVADALSDLLPTDSSAGTLTPTDDGRPRTIALVGPTGVGKTTTIAKLAATFKLKQNKKVGLITLDTYRIAAVDQLRTYAGIIGVELHVVLGPQELQRALDQCRDCDAVLIDTAGRSQRDDHRLDELARFIDAARPHEVHLVLASTCNQSVLMDAIERFSRVRTDSIIFTKLDEAVSFGVLLNVLRKVNKQLSYVTTGQEVPHQIEPGDASRLAALLMGEGRVQS